MKKKIFLTVIIYIIILINFLSIKVYGYSTSQYSIEVPNNYSQQGENYFYDKNGNSFNIVVTDTGAPPKNFKYNDENLEEIAKVYEAKLTDSIISNVSQNLKENYNIDISKEELKTILKDLTIEIISKKVTTFSENNYKCFYFKLNYSLQNVTQYLEQYIVLSDNYVYVLTIESLDANYFTSSEMQNIKNSFTIKNFKNAESSSLVDKIIVTTIVTLILSPFCNKFYKEKKSMTDDNNNITDIPINTYDNSQVNELISILEKEQETSSLEETVNDANIENEEKDTKNNVTYCTECGNELLENHQYCWKCGHSKEILNK